MPNLTADEVLVPRWYGSLAAGRPGIIAQSNTSRYVEHQFQVFSPIGVTTQVFSIPLTFNPGIGQQVFVEIHSNCVTFDLTFGVPQAAARFDIVRVAITTAGVGSVTTRGRVAVAQTGLNITPVFTFSIDNTGGVPKLVLNVSIATLSFYCSGQVTITGIQ